MPTKPTNELPLARQQKVVREYQLRLGVLILLACTALTLVAAVLLEPTYVFLSGNIQAKETYLATIKSRLASADERALGARLTTLGNNATALMTLSSQPSVSARIRETLAVSRPGISLSGFTYTLGVDKKPNTLSLSGVAMTRDALRAFQLALQHAAFVLSADLPISAYAKDMNSSFTIVLSLAP